MHARSTRTVTANPCSPGKLPKVAIPSYLHPISPAVGEMDQKKKRAGCQLKPADLPCTAAPSRGSSLPPRGFLLATPIPKNPNRIYFFPSRRPSFFRLGPAAGLTYARRRGVGEGGVAGPGARLEAEKGGQLHRDYTQAKATTTPSQPLPTPPDPISTMWPIAAD